MLAPGIVLNGRYQLTHRIAAGGMGEVWRGGDRLLHREVAVKVLLPALMNDRDFITRFRSEARMMAQLRHPGIVQVYDYGENAVVDGERFDYLVMEYIDGTSLSKKVQQAGRLSPAETMAITAGVADALHAAHQAGIIHRDVKPSNLLVRPGGAIVLVDFGVARSVGITGITGTNVVMGSAHYMAPEQAEGQPVTAATDVYALGAVAFTCLTGRPPYVGDNPLAVLAQLVHGQPPVLPPDVPRPVAAVVLRALAKDPAQRFPSGAALADAARNAGRPGAAAGYAAGAAGGSGFAPGAGPGFAPGVAPGFTPGVSSGAPSGAAAGHGSGPSGGHPAFQPAYPTRPTYPATPTSTFPAASPPAADPAPRRRGWAVAAGAAGLILVGAGVLLTIHHNPPVTANTGAVGAPPDGQQPPDRTVNQPAPTHKGSKRANPPASPSRSAEPSPSPSGDDETETENRYSPKQLCGDGYEVVDQQALKSAAGVVKGRIFLLHNEDDASNCVVTLRTAGLTRKGPAAAFLEVQGQDRQTRSDTVQYYAGPVKAPAEKACVRWGGAVGALSYDSGQFEHCG
ncbi:serine/threonine protein kinase, bacterial [Actinoplanes sp. SE50]|uniref:serine/threonine-protein kinase n=1 Tax=unclassified Actinoplanes TaxID=2626549 RepID=UPI00023ECF0B|nr:MULTISPECIES: serine/threonine-protein kinase [unclassified Actinoplanes]AEV86597.1 serine/threonine protein kinase, bacterial [Actinoplanes sp. SE50/110]ATO84995.1 serine/threonine protein kinase, bacterial [Actinoplanes sp. SE50]SLM02404.1 hypothetical protein ACSP50_5653 [Actinoplanes sp. SE50/110]